MPAAVSSSELGSYENVGAYSKFQDGTVIGGYNMFGREVEFGRRVSIGKKNVFGFANQFGSNDQLGANNEFGREGLFGDKIMFGKNQEFGSRTTFASPEYFVSGEEFGSRNWGLKDSDLPDAMDRKEWHMQMDKHPEYIPERAWRKRVLTLHQKEAAKKALVKVQAAAKKQTESNARKAKAIAAIEKAAITAEAETKRLKKVADSLQQIKAK